MLFRWDALIKENREDIATILVYETGKPRSEAYGEIDYSTGFTWWFAGEAERIQGSVFTPALPNRRIFTIKQPLGVAVALVPWNFPIAMILRKAGAALAAGCTMVVKPSPETPITVLTLAYLAQKAGFPDGALNVLTTDLDNTPELSEALCRHPLVSKVTFTGSTRVGKLVAKICADNLKKVTLELGGNCPVLIFNDANLEQVLGQIFALKYRHAGQACITANRIYVQSRIYDKFLERWNAETQKIVVGHGSDEKTTMGPVTTPRGIEKATALIEDAKKKGAKILTGGNKIEKDGGYFFEPTIITGVTPDMDISNEEAFAPISTIIKFETEDEAVDAANDTSMGLASYCFTKNVDRTWRLFENLEAGMIGLNTVSSMSKIKRSFTDETKGERFGCRISIRWDKAEWLREGIWKRCRCERVSHHQDWYLHARRTVLERMIYSDSCRYLDEDGCLSLVSWVRASVRNNGCVNFGCLDARPLHQLYSTTKYLICCHLSIAQFIHNHENLLTICATHSTSRDYFTSTSCSARPRELTGGAPASLHSSFQHHLTPSSLPVYRKHSLCDYRHNGHGHDRRRLRHRHR
jgi:succinate-semialdehyde dehydrogenase/glutarate-semialdehyde dehydrogenase